MSGSCLGSLGRLARTSPRTRRAAGTPIWNGASFGCKPLPESVQSAKKLALATGTENDAGEPVSVFGPLGPRLVGGSAPIAPEAPIVEIEL